MNIFLVGYRGTGKTSLGRFLSIELQKKFVDTDELIVEREGRYIPQIFEESGETYFREVESSVLDEVSHDSGLIISTGGGIVISQVNRDVIKSSGYCVYLTATPEVIYKRIAGDSNRPSLTEKDELNEIKELLEKRNPWYSEIAQFTIDTGALTISEAQTALKIKIDELAG